MSFYNKLFFSILTAFTPLTNHAFFYDVCNVKQQLYAEDWFGHRGKTLSISYMLNSKNRVFNPYFSTDTRPMRKALLRII